ncbi:NAD-dependent epimerase/dehydratase family protein [Pedobacter alpinus]|uniref:NAD-dependent epimerase/dehydratase family protein n=1 Tax=Pedobacter alpinus TaxID=1590643 RepID=A0ABW5TRP6_9SPHI
MIIITGSSGFAGTNLISYLQDFDKQELSLRYQPSQEIDLQNADAIIHLSGKAHDLKKVSQPQDYYEANFELTKQLYDAFIKSDARKFIFISSVKAAADSVNGFLPEDVIPNPQTHYGKSKLMAEEYIKSQTLPAGKSYYILRPCMIHGPGNKGNLNLLYQFVKKGIPYPLAAFENQRSFLSVENLCFVIKELLERDIPSGIYNLADDEALSTNELVAEIAKTLNLKPKLWAIPAKLIQSLAKVGDVLKLPLNSERLGKLTENYVVSNQKIKKNLGKELPISTRAGLKKTISSFN